MKVSFRFSHYFVAPAPSLARQAVRGTDILPAADLPAEVYQGARRGWQIFPAFCPAGRLSGELEECLGDAVSDVNQLMAMACNEPTHWRLKTGKASGVCVLLAEGEAGRDSLCRLCAESYEFVSTLQASSLTGDVLIFYFFRWPHVMILRYPGRKLRKGLRILGEGDSVPVPMAVGGSGVPIYRDPDTSVEACPAWLLDYAFIDEPVDVDDASDVQRTSPRREGHGFGDGYPPACSPVSPAG